MATSAFILQSELLLIIQIQLQIHIRDLSWTFKAWLWMFANSYELTMNVTDHNQSWIIMVRELSTIMDGGASWNRGAMKYFEELGGGTIAMGIKNAHVFKGGPWNFSAHSKGCCENCYHHGNFNLPSPLPRSYLVTILEHKRSQSFIIQLLHHYHSILNISFCHIIIHSLWKIENIHEKSKLIQ